jgi:hypothetical protein
MSDLDKYIEKRMKKDSEFANSYEPGYEEFKKKTNMFYTVKKASYAGEYKIELLFEDGSSGIVDLSEYPNKGNVFNLFLNMNYFRNFRIEHGTLVWGDGELDIAPETLYEKATGKPLTYNRVKDKT